MTQKERVKKIKDALFSAEQDAAICKDNDGKLYRYYEGKAFAYKRALAIVSS